MTRTGDGRGPSSVARASDGVASIEGPLFVLAMVLAAIAGWVDATGFLAFKGLFVSFMSGNSTKSVVAAGHDWPEAIEGARAIFVFIGGVVLGELVGPACGAWGRPVVLGVEALLLWAAVAGSGAGEPVAAPCLGLAMGLQNASVHRAGGSSVALTYFTGTMVHIGRLIAAALRGDEPWRALLPFLALWLGLVVGGLGGATTARWSPIAAMLVAAVVVTLLCGWTVTRVARGRVRPADRPGP